MDQEEQGAQTIQTYNLTAKQWSKAHSAVNDWVWAAKRLSTLLLSGTLLEIGCGGGRDAGELLRLGYEYLGTDASTAMVQEAV